MDEASEAALADQAALWAAIDDMAKRHDEHGLGDADWSAIGALAFDRWRERGTDALRFYRRRIAPIPEKPLLGALAGWKSPWAIDPIDPPGAPRLDGTVVVLSGPVGTGKSAIAARWLLRDERPDRARWIRALDLDRYGHEVDDAIYWATIEPRRVVIDDAAAGSQLEGKHVAEIMLARADASRPTLVTTNATRVQFAHQIGDRIFDRVDSWVEMPGESKRTGSDADRWKAEMAKVQRIYEERAKPMAAAFRALLESRRHGSVRRRDVEALVDLDGGTHGDRQWLDDTIAAMIAGKGTT
jgi:hypothetical protein